MAGSNLQQTAGAWAAANSIATINQFNFMGTNGNVFELFDVGLYQGTAAPSFKVPDLTHELLRCKRYYALVDVTGQSAAIGNTMVNVQWPVQMRIVPTITVVVAGTMNNASVLQDTVSSVLGGYMQLSASAANGYVVGRRWGVDARM
jgi:hypothetical protein